MGLPHPQRELLVVSLKNLSPTSKRSSLCIFEFFALSSPTLNERFSLSRCQRTQQALPTSKRSSLCIFEFFPLSSPTLNERFSLSRCQRAQRALPTSKRSSLCIFEFFTLYIYL